MRGILKRAVHPAVAVALLGTLVAVVVTAPEAAAAGARSLVTIGTPVTENFDTLAISGTSSVVPSGAAFVESGTGADLTYAASNGSLNGGNTYSYGTSLERAFGGLLSGSLVPTLGYELVNATGTTIDKLDVAYTGEQWRLASSTRTDQLDVQVSTDATSLTDGTWVDVDALDFVAPTSTPVGALDGNAAANRTAISATISGLTLADGATIWLRWNDFNASGADDGLAIDDLSVTPHAPVAPVVPSLSVSDITQAEGNAGTSVVTFTVSLSAPAGAGGVTFDIATADQSATAGSDYEANSLTGQTISAGSSTSTFSVTVNGDTTPEPDETFGVDVTNVTGATVADGAAVATILDDDLVTSFIHDLQGNGPSTPLPGATVLIRAIVTGDFQAPDQLQAFFLQEPHAEADADPNTSEGIFVTCGTCTVGVAAGDDVSVTGTVADVDGRTQVAASSTVVNSTGNGLPAPVIIGLPLTGAIDPYLETVESMRVTFTDPLTVGDVGDLDRLGQLSLFAGGRPRAFTDGNAPDASDYQAHLDDLARRRVLLDDDNDRLHAYLGRADGFQAVFHPATNGGFSTGTQGPDFVRAGDGVTGLTGVQDFASPGTGPASWRLRPSAASFTVANPRSATPPAVGGSIRSATIDLGGYFTTIDATASTATGPCGPSATLDCRGADSVAELNRQRERLSLTICTTDPDVAALTNLENTTAAATITDLLGAVNTRCGGAEPFTFVNTGGTLGVDAERVALIYRQGILQPVGAALVDLDPVHSRPPTAQTFEVADPTNPAHGQRWTVVATHLTARVCDAAATGVDADAGDGQACYNDRRTAQADRLADWMSSTVLPVAGDPDVEILGNLNAYGLEDPVLALTAAGYVDAGLGEASYTTVVDGERGRLDHVLLSASLAPNLTGVADWHTNADESDLFDYSDEIADPGESAVDEKPDGSALVPPRVVFQPSSPYRSSDHDPLIAGLFDSTDLSVAVSDSPDPVTAGANLTYSITVTNAGPVAAAAVSMSDALPPGTTFVSLSSPGGWSCTTPAVNAAGTVACSKSSLAPGPAAFSLVVAVAPATVAGTVLSNTATVSSSTADSSPGGESSTAVTTVATSADLSVAVSDSPDPVMAGSDLTYSISVANAGPSSAAAASWSDTLPAGTTFVSLSAPAGWSCTTPAVGSAGTVACTAASLAPGSAVFSLIVRVEAGPSITNTVTVSSSTADPTPGDRSASASTTVIPRPVVRGTVTVVADPTFAVEGGSPGAFVVTRSGSTAASLVVRFQRGGSATSGTDYAALPIVAIIPAGSASATIEVDALVDDVDAIDGDETLTVSVVPDAAYLVGSPAAATVSILEHSPQRPCTGVPPSNYSDRATAGVHTTNVDCVTAYRLLQGHRDGTFRPAVAVTRAQMASVVVRLLTRLGVDLPPDPPDAFPGDDGEVHERAIDQLAAIGLWDGTTGEHGDRFGVSEPVRRDDMAQILANAYEAITGSPLPRGMDAFSDDSESDNEGAIDALARADVVSGTGGGLYGPSGLTTRARFASLIGRFLQLLVDAGQAAPR